MAGRSEVRVYGGSRGKAPVGRLGDEVPQKLKHFLKIGINFYQK